MCDHCICSCIYRRFQYYIYAFMINRIHSIFICMRVYACTWLRQYPTKLFYLLSRTYNNNKKNTVNISYRISILKYQMLYWNIFLYIKDLNLKDPLKKTFINTPVSPSIYYFSQRNNKPNLRKLCMNPKQRRLSAFSSYVENSIHDSQGM